VERAGCIECIRTAGDTEGIGCNKKKGSLSWVYLVWKDSRRTLNSSSPDDDFAVDTPLVSY